MCQIQLRRGLGLCSRSGSHGIETLIRTAF
jgi:hypothetical protein